MNSIGHFWSLEIEPQNDFMEGVEEVLSADDFTKRYGLDFKSVFEDHILLPIQVRLEVYKYLHILCFMMLEYDLEYREVMSVDQRMKSMGKYAVRINDVQAFVDLLFEKLKLSRQYGLMGPVNYHDVRKTSRYRDCFDKKINNAYEREWRFALIPDYEKAKTLANSDPKGNVIYDEYIKYKVGDLRQIAEEINVDKLLSDSGSLYSDEKGRFKTVNKMTVSAETRKQQMERLHKELGLGIPYQAYPWQYVGWASREAFRDKVIGLGSGIKPVFTIG